MKTISKKVLLLFLLTSFSIFSQITGKVTNTKQEPLPFVSVYLENSVTGTTTNNNGDYNLEIKHKGKHTIIFQFLGFKTVKKSIDVSKFPYTLNVTLQEEQVSLEEVEINTKENPANRIIRNTIANKDQNTDKLGKYTADFYSRGLFKIKDAPETFLGMDVGDFGGGLDSTRTGVIYLSETISKIKYQKNPKNFNEYIIASKVSGKDNGISFNQADDVNFNFYENSFELADIKMISPIANGAFGYYNYKLSGTFYDKNGRLINKIKLLPKREKDRVFNGFIYIVEDDWAIYGADVYISGKQVGIPMIKDLKIKQNYNFDPSTKSWPIVTQIIDFKAGLLGFNFDGRFTATYSNYNLEPTFSSKSFTNEVLAFSENATKKDSAYWNTIRPMPLTKEEIKDYKVKDSIKTIRSSKKYLDSVDTGMNKFNILNILTGYTYSNTYKKWSIDVSSPIEKLSFNTVQGWNTGIDVNFSKQLNETGKNLDVGLKTDYGFSDKRARTTGHFSYKWNNISYPKLQLSGGVTTTQFNSKKPISRFWNTISSVFFERNYLKLYEKTFAKATYSQELTNGLHLFTGLEYADRNPLFNTTSYVMFPQEDVNYTSNNPLQPNNFNTPSFIAHKMWTFDLGFSIQFGQKYLSYPNRKINIDNKKYPSLYIGYKKNFGSGNEAWDSDVVFSQINQQVSLDNWGDFKYRVKGGLFLEKKDIPFMDYAHFNSNRLTVAPQNNYLNGFLLLPYYTLSTNDRYSEMHAEQNFRGALLNKIPLLNQLNYHLVIGAKALFTKENKPYSEFSIGLDNIGIGEWNILRVDFVQSNFNGRKENTMLFGIKL
ncbi:CarboxypepD_reg-like domain-containing protein [Tenacibaculum sp. 190524A02b]|uniref:DUF5686 and carboxypeptidase regulatory-like domain-containing protein n=1 Tax=Tenacibaculum vairaonense TaxID=3137860 RepID=UPI0032B25861